MISVCGRGRDASPCSPRDPEPDVPRHDSVMRSRPGDGMSESDSRPYAPATMPVAERLFNGHALGILRHRLLHRWCSRKQHPGLGLALRRRTRRLRLAALFVGAVLGMGLGPLGPLTHRARVLLVLRRGRNGSAHDDPTRHQGLLWPPTAHGGGSPLPDD